ncbi:MAG: hypothetical protein KGI65_10300 [Acidobacteriota bacterium]|nr:hypothetical protein [Acidobacteriota bacterium]MDE3083542.1 hypothetical protein [Acidobacteriota bacterium]
MSRAYTYALGSQLTLLAFIGVCLALHPGLVLKWNEAGLSNYGIHIRTAIPYSLAFAGSATFAVMAARATPSDSRARIILRVVLGVYATLSVLALLSTYGYTLNTTLQHVHMAAGITLMVFEPLASIWLYLQLRGFRRDAAWLVLELLGLVLAAIDLAAWLHVLFLAQALTGVSFGVLLVHATRRIVPPPSI